MFSAKSQPRVQVIPSIQAKGASGSSPQSHSTTNGNGAALTGSGGREYVIVLDGDEILLFRKVPISVSWASAGKYPLRFAPTQFDLVSISGKSVHAG